MNRIILSIILFLLATSVFAVPSDAPRTGAGRYDARVSNRQATRSSFNTPPSQNRGLRTGQAGADSALRGVVPYRSFSDSSRSPYSGSYYSPVTGSLPTLVYPKTSTGLNISSYPKSSYKLPYISRDTSGISSGMPKFDEYNANKILAQTYSRGSDLRPFTENIKEFEYYLKERNFRTPNQIQDQRDLLSRKYRIEAQEFDFLGRSDLGSIIDKEFKGDKEDFGDDDTVETDDIFAEIRRKQKEAGLDAEIAKSKDMADALDGENMGIKDSTYEGRNDAPREEIDYKDKMKMRLNARSVLGEYKTFAGYSDDKFNSYMKKAEDFMDEGEFYRAADAYSLASIFRKNDPLVHAGQSLALFGSGEYMSSSYYLNKALTLYPDYIAIKVDLVEMLGDRDVLESRVVDIQRWMARSGAGELSFLLAYIYYQMDEPEWAKQELENAADVLPFKQTAQLLADMVGADISGSKEKE